MISAIEIQRIRELAAPIFKTHGINEAYLYGSRARGDNSPSSDYDFYCVIPDSIRPFGMSKVGPLVQDLNFALRGEIHIIDAPYLEQTNPAFYLKMIKERVSIL